MVAIKVRSEAGPEVRARGVSAGNGMAWSHCRLRAKLKGEARGRHRALLRARLISGSGTRTATPSAAHLPDLEGTSASIRGDVSPNGFMSYFFLKKQCDINNRFTAWGSPAQGQLQHCALLLVPTRAFMEVESLLLLIQYLDDQQLSVRHWPEQLSRRRNPASHKTTTTTRRSSR